MIPKKGGFNATEVKFQDMQNVATPFVKTIN